MTEYAIAYDATCECGAVLRGAYSADECEFWAETHEHMDDPEC